MHRLGSGVRERAIACRAPAWCALLREMPEERRSSRRARVPGMHVTFETAAGERLEGEVLDISPGGLFVRAEKAIAVGKRLSLEIRFAEGEPRSALARVVWAR